MSNQKQSDFMKLYAPVHTRLSGFCNAIAGNKEFAKDLLSETVLTAYEKFDKLDCPEVFLHFLFGIAIRHNKQNKRKTSRLQLFEKTPVIAEPQSAFQNNQEAEHLYTALNQIPDDQREAIVLFEISGFKTEEIAKLQNCSPVAVRLRLVRGRERLRKLLGVKVREKILTSVVEPVSALVLLMFASENIKPISEEELDNLFEAARNQAPILSLTEVEDLLENANLRFPSETSRTPFFKRYRFIYLNSALVFIGCSLFFFFYSQSETKRKQETKQSTQITEVYENTPIENKKLKVSNNPQISSASSVAKNSKKKEDSGAISQNSADNLLAATNAKDNFWNNLLASSDMGTVSSADTLQISSRRKHSSPKWNDSTSEETNRIPFKLQKYKKEKANYDYFSMKPIVTPIIKLKKLNIVKDTKQIAGLHYENANVCRKGGFKIADKTKKYFVFFEKEEIEEKSKGITTMRLWNNVGTYNWVKEIPERFPVLFTGGTAEQNQAGNLIFTKELVSKVDLNTLVPVAVPLKNFFSWEKGGECTYWYPYSKELLKKYPRSLRKKIISEYNLYKKTEKGVPTASRSDLFEGSRATLPLVEFKVQNQFVNDEVKLYFDTNDELDGSVILLNMQGESIKVLWKTSFFKAGKYEIKFTVKDIPNGMYIVALNTDKGFRTTRIFISR